MTDQPTDIDPNALVACPKVQFNLVRIVDACLRCPYHQGFERCGETGDFASDWRVICAKPLTRTIQTIREL